LNFEICITHSSNLKLQSYFPRLFGCTDFIDGIYSVSDLRFYLSFLLGANQLSALSPSSTVSTQLVMSAFRTKRLKSMQVFFDYIESQPLVEQRDTKCCLSEASSLSNRKKLVCVPMKADADVSFCFFFLPRRKKKVYKTKCE
jgi:hypothetical protein